jgi:hypothetical protein
MDVVGACGHSGNASESKTKEEDIGSRGKLGTPSSTSLSQRLLVISRPRRER